MSIGDAAPRSARLVRCGKRAPAENMAEDEALLRSAPALPVLRLYGWSPPGLSLGRFQSELEATRALLAFPGATVVRRPTGGGAIYHDDEVTYALVLDLRDPLLEGASIAESYFRLDAPVVAAFARFGIRARHREPLGARERRRDEPFFCFDRESRLDVIADGVDGRTMKVAGSAQRRTKTHVLQHGSALLRGHPAIAGAAGVNDLRPDAATPVSFDEFADGLESEFARVLSLRFERRPGPEDSPAPPMRLPGLPR